MASGKWAVASGQWPQPKRPRGTEPKRPRGQEAQRPAHLLMQAQAVAVEWPVGSGHWPVASGVEWSGVEWSGVASGSGQWQVGGVEAKRHRGQEA